MQVDALNVDGEGAQEMVIVENYRGTSEAPLQAEHAGGPIANDCARLPRPFQSLTINLGGFFSQPAPGI